MSAQPQHPFQGSDNPRDGGRCACGRPEADHPDRITPPARNPEFEAAFLSGSVDIAEKFGHVRWDGYSSHVRHRLAIGAERYGDTSFFSRDNLKELLEETPDIGAYAVLEAQRLLAEHGEDSEEYYLDKHDLMAAAAFGALADHHARRIVRRRAGLD